MKKVLLTILLCILTCGMLSARTKDHKKSPFHLSFVTPLSTNGLYSSEYTNDASFNILVGLSENEKAFTFGGLSNIILNDATGFQFAGLSNYVGNNGKGFQFSGLTNIILNDATGFQFAGLSNYVGNNGKGFQFGGMANINGNDFSGFQFAGLVNYTGNNGKGFQFGGLSNINKNDFSGFQFAGLVNYAGNNNKGFQFGGLANINRNNFSGFQFAGLVNIAGNVDGVQFAGLVNIAEDSDCPIGLVNIIKKGEKGISVTYDILGNTLLSFRSGGKYTYGILGVGYNHKTNGNSLVTEGGFGAHILCTSWFRINNELKVSCIGSSSDNPLISNGYFLLPAFRIGKHCELFGGASINYMTTENQSNSKLFTDKYLWRKNTGNRLQQLYLGYQVGVQYIF